MIEKLFITGAYYGALIDIMLILIWVSLALVNTVRKHLGGSSHTGGALAGTGRSRIGPRD
jgi:hypothetical protein